MLVTDPSQSFNEWLQIRRQIQIGRRNGPESLEQIIPLSEPKQRKKLRPIWLFLEASATVSAPTEFLLLWVAVESCANENYEAYKDEVGDLFSRSEKEKLQEIVLEAVDEEFNEKQTNLLESRFRQDYLYEHSIDLKMNIFSDYLDIGFNMDEIGEIVTESKTIRNLVVHEGDSSYLFDGNINRLGELRKILIFLILRPLGVDKETQSSLIIPIFQDPKIS